MAVSRDAPPSMRQTIVHFNDDGTTIPHEELLKDSAAAVDELRRYVTHPRRMVSFLLNHLRRMRG